MNRSVWPAREDDGVLAVGVDGLGAVGHHEVDPLDLEFLAGPLFQVVGLQAEPHEHLS